MTYTGHEPQECLYDVPYQVLRMKCIRNWTTVTGAETNIVRLLQYIGRAKGTYWHFVRVWRVMSAVGAAKRTLEARGLEGPVRVCTRAMTALIREYVKWESDVWKEQHPRGPHKVRRGGPQHPGSFKKWDWNVTKTQLEHLLETNPGMFDTLQRHYEGKAYGNPNADFSRMRTDVHLAHFVRLIRDVKFEHGVIHGE